jgi:hypothetical protein
MPSVRSIGNGRIRDPRLWLAQSTSWDRKPPILLRHASAGVTAQVYARLTDDVRKPVTSKLAEADFGAKSERRNSTPRPTDRP